MSLELIPAIDLMDGQCVRLTEGEYDTKQVYSNNPPDMAAKFQEQGAERLHLVDLDGAFGGSMNNRQVIEQIATRVEIPVQVGGGIRSFEAIEELLKLGVDRVILGTKAYKDPDFLRSAIETYGEQIVVGVDVKGEQVATEGWVNVSNTGIGEYLDRLVSTGVKRVIVTDISKDGKLQGPNLDMLVNLLEYSQLNFILSGGISSLEDLQKLKQLRSDSGSNLEGVILGKSLYEQKIDLRTAVTELR